MRRRLRLWLFAAGLMYANAALADSQKIFVSSGTGFIISPGYVVTNLHVVSYCQRIIVQGAMPPQLAKTIGRDQTHDLALLAFDASGGEAGWIRGASLPVVQGEPVMVIGYPGEAAKTNRLVARQASITATKGPKGEDTWVQFDDRVKEGNSGGPLLDEGGNIIGVVAARAVIYSYQKDRPDEGSYSQSGIAIAPHTLRAFLGEYNVPYRVAEATTNLSAERIMDKARQFTVSVRCETPTDLR